METQIDFLWSRNKDRCRRSRGNLREDNAAGVYTEEPETTRFAVEGTC